MGGKDKSKYNEGEIRPSIKVYMIRHAESANNEVYRNARLIYKGGTPQFDYHGWENYVNKNRAADPTISSTGIKQATKLKEYLVPHLNHQASQPVKVITSPMTRTIKTILPTLQALKREKVDLVVNGLYFESEGCHLKGTPLPGMNQNEIKDILSQSIDIGDTQSDNQSDNQSDSTIHAHDPTFVGFHEDPNLGWYNYGLGPETRSESEVRATAFYTWLCEYLDEQLMSPNIEKNDNDNGNDDIYDAGVTLPEEVDEIDHDKLSERHRRRRTVILVGHGDFMSLCLKRIISGFGHSVENFGITHRTAFTHFNTGITELEYFGKGRFLVMHTNDTPHLNNINDSHLKTGGYLKDGWSYLMPQDKILLYQEVTSAFADELDDHVKEQTDALKNLYLSRKGNGSFLLRKDSSSTPKVVQEGAGESEGTGEGKGEGTSEASTDNNKEDKDINTVTNEMTFVIQRGLQVVGCVTYDDEKSLISDMVVRPSAKDGNPQKELISAVIAHAKEKGKTEVYVECNTEGMYQVLGFVSHESKDGEGTGMLKLTI